MSENNENNEIEPCDGCGEIHEPSASGTDPSSVVRRFLTDSHGDEYINVKDIEVALQTLLNAQAAFGRAPEGIDGLIMRAQFAIATGFMAWCHEVPGVPPTSPESVPDTIPADWLDA